MAARRPTTSTPKKTTASTAAKKASTRKSPSSAVTRPKVAQPVELEALADKGTRLINPWAILAVVVALTVGIAVFNRDGSSDGVAKPTDTTATNGSLPTTLLEVALKFHSEGKLDEAMKAYNAVLNVEPTNKFALYNIGVIEQGRKNLPSAIEYYTKALKSDAKFQPARYNRGLAYRDDNQPGLAIGDLQEVVAADPKNASALYNLGNLFVSVGRTSEGGKLLAQALNLNPALAKG